MPSTPYTKSAGLQQIGENIRKWRLLKGYKQAAFAAELEISGVALSKIETGKTDIPLGRLFQIAFVLELRVEMLFSDPQYLLQNQTELPLGRVIK